MALIKCKECGHEVSDKASVCPNCGCPIQYEDNPSVKSSVKPHPQKQGNSKKWVIVALLLCLLAGGGYFIYTLFNGANNKDAIVELTPEFIETVQKYDKLSGFSDGYAAVCKDDKWGYINTKGKEVVPIQYSDAKAFHEGLAAVQKEGKWGYVDSKGKEIIPTNIEAEYAGRFSEGLAFIYINESEFSVIDTKGHTVSKGNCDFSWYLGPDVEESFLPYYNQGKLYVALETDKFAVYDTKGNKVSEVSQATKDELESQNKTNKPYTVFTKENGDNEDYQWYTNGLKDENGEEVIPAIYDGIIYDGADERIDVHNGVVLVMLDEIEEGAEVIEGFGGEFDTGNYKHYYGYADLKGNDTFSKELKKRCEESKKRAANQLFQQEANDLSFDVDWQQGDSSLKSTSSQSPSWIQGVWTYDMNSPVGIIASYKIEINGTRMTFYRNGKNMWSENFIYEYEKLIGSSHELRINEGSHRIIDENGNRYNHEGGSSLESFQFRTGQDVIGYLSGKTYRSNGNSLQIRQDGCYINGQCVSGAPVVIDYSSYSATVRANLIPSGFIMLYINSKNGTLIDSSGELWH